jgi:DNA-binding Xre family transcriptional regulator
MDSASAATARNVEAARTAAGVTIMDLSAASGIPYASLHRLLRGQAAWKLEQLAAVAAPLGVNPSELVEFQAA